MSAPGGRAGLVPWREPQLGLPPGPLLEQRQCASAEEERLLCAGLRTLEQRHMREPAAVQLRPVPYLAQPQLV